MRRMDPHPLVACAVLVTCAGAAHAQTAPPVAFRTVADLPLPGRPGRFDYQSLDVTGRRLYLAQMGGGTVIAVDPSTLTVLGTVAGLPRVTAVWVVPELGRLYASVPGLHQVAIIDTKRLAVLRRVGSIGFPDGIAYAPGVRKVFVSDEAGGGELVIDAVRDSATGTIPLGGEAGNTIYDPGTGRILVAVQTRNEVVAIDPVTDGIVGRYPLAGADRPHGMAEDAEHRLLFVANEGNATVLVVDLRTMRVNGSQPVGDDPDVLAFDSGWQRLYVAAESGSITALDERDGRLVRTGSVRLPRAHSVSVSPSTHRLYVPLERVGDRPVLRVLEPTAPAERSARSPR